MKKLIVGAGLAGLLAACKFPDAEIIEAGEERKNHNAVLRFRNESVSKLTGIPFKEVRVQKGVFDGFTTLSGQCPIDLQNKYSLKVTNGLLPRSVTDLSPSKRYIAPADLQAQLIERFRSRITFGMPIDSDIVNQINEDNLTNGGVAWISTAPIKWAMETFGVPFDTSRLRTESTPITVDRIRLEYKDCDVYQTVYFPQNDTQVYRASIEGNVLIIESGEYGTVLNESLSDKLEVVLTAFGLPKYAVDLSSHESIVQPFGKIVPLDSDIREAALFELTHKHNVFSLGRFACWRSILLDDVADDVSHLARLIDSSHYRRFLNK